MIKLKLRMNIQTYDYSKHNAAKAAGSQKSEARIQNKTLGASDANGFREKVC